MRTKPSPFGEIEYWDGNVYEGRDPFYINAHCTANIQSKRLDPLTQKPRYTKAIVNEYGEVDVYGDLGGHAKYESLRSFAARELKPFGLKLSDFPNFAKCAKRLAKK